MSFVKVVQTEWNLKPLFNDDGDSEIEKQRKKVMMQTEKFVEKWDKRDDFLKEPKILKQALDDYEYWTRNFGTDGAEGYYFGLRFSQNQLDSSLKAKLNKVIEFGMRLQNKIQFFELRLAKVSAKQQQKFLQSDELNEYKHFLEKLFAESKYLLSELEEKIINLKSAPAHGNWVRMVTGFLSKEERSVLLESGKRKNKSFSEISTLMNSPKKAVRDGASEVFNQILEQYVDVAEAEINSVLQNKKINDDLRGMKRPDLSRHLSDDIDTEVVDVLLKSVEKRFDLSRRYYQLKAKLMGVEKLGYHERNVPYGTLNQKYTFQEAVNLVVNVFEDLDVDFKRVFVDLVNKGRFDVFPRKGKSSGAYCAHYLLVHPIYILLNHTGLLNDVLTLAHEVGHGIHFQLMKEKQCALNVGSPKSIAEVASTFMEDFVLERLTKKTDNEFRLSVVMMKLNDDVSTIFRQVACYRFEQELHREFRKIGYLSKVKIGELFQKHMFAYMGDGVERSNGSENWWVYWSHIRNFFYNYSYASGLLISKVLQDKTRKDKKFIGKVKEFFSAGTSDSPRNIFMRMGIDICDDGFWNHGLSEVERLLVEAERLADIPL